MSHYTGPQDSTRTNPECVTGELVASWVLNITGACDNPRGARRVKPFRAENPPPNEAWTNWFSPVSNGNPAEEEEGSQEGSVDSVEYVSDSGETEEESREEEGEDGEQSSPPPPPEPRTKRRHEPMVASAPPAASSAPPAAHVVSSALPATPLVPSARRTKRTRDSAAEPAGQPSKVAKPSGSKPRKALSRMRIAVPVASAAATSATSLPRQGDDPMDTDNVVTSQQVGFPSEVIPVEEDDQERSEQATVPVLEKTCEMGSAYDALRAEKIQFAAELDAAMLALAGLKGVLVERDKYLEESREANKALVAEMEKMGKQRTELMGQMQIFARTLRLKQLTLSGRFFRTFHSARTPIETCSERTFA
ncbi:hypothetical protein ZWY2020_032228 [Hordeum vulgare]|nr:hypothetical protein ZWY2020_032228 [Hordeum vulgare]